MSRLFSRIFAAVTTALLVLAPLTPISAATLLGRRDVMSRQSPGQGANHEIRFITPTGVDASSDTITIDFPGGFVLSGIGFGDVDLYHGPVTGFETFETIAAAPAAGVWGASVSGNQLTLTAPTDAVGGEISASDIVFVRIGTNAAGGTNQIINPSATSGGTKTISIGGTFGDVGGIDVFVGPNDTISVSATVAATTTGSSGGGGGGSSMDLTPPTILNIQVLNITTSTSLVAWDTSENANTQISWGTDVSYSLGSFSNGTYTIGHSVPLSGLPPGTLIHFRITATDPAGNVGMSGDQTFTTLTSGAPPIISNVQAISITDTTAVITWDTNIPASSNVEYGVTPAYGGAANSPGNVTSHVVSLFGLAPGTTYHFRVQSTEPIGLLTAVSGDFTFTTTIDLTPPANVFGFTATAGNTQNQLNWSLPSDPDFSFVRIRARTDGYPTGPNDGRLVYQGSGTSFLDTGLVNGTTYFYANYAFDSVGNNSSGAFAQATPFALSLPPTSTPPIVTPPVTPPTGGSSTTTPPIVTPPTTTPPIVIPPTSTPSLPGLSITPSYYAAGGAIPLEPDASGAVGSAPGAPILVRVPVSGLPSEPLSAVIRVGNSVYALTPLPGGMEWGATFVPSRNVERIPATVQFTLENGQVASASTVIETRGAGRVLERKGITSDLTPVEGAVVRLYERLNGQWVEWNGARYGQRNPEVTGGQGFYGFIVQNGDYRVVVEKEGYVTQEKEFRVTRNYASIDVVLPTQVPVPLIGPVLEFLQSETARDTANITVPILVALAIANLAAAASLFSLLNYIWFLLTQPALLLGRKQREKWGVVYNALSKQTIELATVRLINAETRLVVQTRVTDSKGRFAFRVRPGTYRIEVVKPGFTFPTVYLKDEKEDVDYLDLYHGEPIQVKEESNLAVNIPLDPAVKEETPRIVYFKRFLRRFQYLFSLLSVFITIGAFIVSPSWWIAALIIVQLLTFFLFLRLARPKKPKEWGVVYDSISRKPLGSAIVRIFDSKFNKLLETQITNPKGQYGFFAAKSVYVVTAQKSGYTNYKSENIDLSQKKEAVIDQHIPLKKN
jgi:hypothetical protein